MNFLHCLDRELALKLNVDSVTSDCVIYHPYPETSLMSYRASGPEFGLADAAK